MAVKVGILWNIWLAVCQSQLVSAKVICPFKLGWYHQFSNKILQTDLKKTKIFLTSYTVSDNLITIEGPGGKRV